MDIIEYATFCYDTVEVENGQWSMSPETVVQALYPRKFKLEEKLLVYFRKEFE